MIQAIYTSKERDGIIGFQSAVFVVAGKGIEGDRYYQDRNRKSDDYQITFIESEKVDAYNRSHSRPIEYWQPRRNILTRGVALDTLIGAAFRIGEARFEGLETCEPCAILRRRTSPDAFKWFAGRGGLRARILRSGRIRIGDALEAEG
jgi:MOSC domain-containing protein YiiM